MFVEASGYSGCHSSSREAARERSHHKRLGSTGRGRGPDPPSFLDVWHMGKLRKEKLLCTEHLLLQADILSKCFEETKLHFCLPKLNRWGFNGNEKEAPPAPSPINIAEYSTSILDSWMLDSLSGTVQMSSAYVQSVQHLDVSDLLCMQPADVQHIRHIPHVPDSLPCLLCSNYGKIVSGLVLSKSGSLRVDSHITW